MKNIVACLAVVAGLLLPVGVSAETKKIVLVAGKPSHPPRMHEFNAGVQLLAKCLADTADVEAAVLLNGWPQDESVFDDADAVVFFMDGGGKHEIVQQDGRRLTLLDALASRGVGLGFMHYGVEVLADQAAQKCDVGLVATTNTCIRATRSGSRCSLRCPSIRSREASSRFKSKTNGTSTCGSFVTCLVTKPLGSTG